MKHLNRSLALCVVVLLDSTLVSAQVDTVTIVHFNDTHSCLASIGPRTAKGEGTQGGIARAASLIGHTKMTEPNVITLHAGDLFIGDLFFNEYFGVPELRMMSALGFDAMSLGNHEFDLTPTALRQALDTAFSATPQFWLVSANTVLDDPGVRSLRRYIRPYTIRQCGDKKVGIFGMTTPSTNIVSQPSPAFIDTNIIGIAASIVDTLTALGCHLIVCLSHLGIQLDEAIAIHVPGIHAIIGGHDHYLLHQPAPVRNTAGDTTWLCQANAFYLDMGKLKFAVGSTSARLLTAQIIPLNNTVPADTAVASAVSGLIAGIEAVDGPVYTRQIATATGFFEEVADSLNSAGYHDTPVGNLVADAFRRTMGTDIGIEPGGSTAQPFYQGPIVPADAFRVVGYGFNRDNGLGYRMATFEITGEHLIAGVEFGLADLEHGDDNFIQVSGMTYNYDATQPPFGRVVSACVGNAPLDPSATYSVATNEFVPMMLDAAGIPYTHLHLCSGDTTEFHTLATYIGQSGTMNPSSGARIQCVAGVTEMEGSTNAAPPDNRLERNSAHRGRRAATSLTNDEAKETNR